MIFQLNREFLKNLFFVKLFVDFERGVGLSEIHILLLSSNPGCIREPFKRMAGQEPVATSNRRASW